MEEKILLEKLKNAIERATKNVIMVNSFNSFIPFGSLDGKEELEYFEQLEALVKAMIYHEMVNDGIPMADISMEVPIANKIQKSKHFDFYISNVICDGKANEFFIEVKTFATYQNGSAEKESEKTIKQIKNEVQKITDKKGNIIDGTIYYDINKLHTAINESGVKAIMIIVDQSHFVKDVDSVNIVREELKALLKKSDFSDKILFAIADNSRAEIISASEIKAHKA